MKVLLLLVCFVCVVCLWCVCVCVIPIFRSVLILVTTCQALFAGSPEVPIRRLFLPLLSLQDAPYLDLAPYMPDYYKPQYLLDFEDRLPSSVHGSDSLSLNSFNSVTSTNLEWDDSAIAPSSEGK